MIIDISLKRSSLLGFYNGKSEWRIMCELNFSKKPNSVQEIFKST